RELVSDQSDGRLAGRAARGLDAHLERCPPCRSVAAETRTVKEWLATVPAPVAGPDFWDRALARARAEAPSARVRRSLQPLLRWQRIAAWGSVMAAAALVLAAPVRLQA